MFNFEFWNPTRIIFGKDTIGAVDTYIPKNARVLIIYGGGSVVRHGTLDLVKKALGSRTYVEYGGVEPNPQYSTLMGAVKVGREHNVDFLLAVGGGSVMDGTKFIAMAMKYEGDALDLLSYKVNPESLEDVIPMGTVVTLPATGSEMNRGAVISHGHIKTAVFNDKCYPVFSVLDPTLSFTLPKNQVANGIVDAFVHVLEQYVTYPVHGAFQDRTAEGILISLIENAKPTLENPTDYDARANLYWNATMALNGLIGAGVPQDWATHLIGHEITAMFGLDHAQTLAIIQPALWEIRKEQKKEKLAQYAERVWGIHEGTQDEKAQKAIEKTRAFFESIGMKTHLSEYGIEESAIEGLIKELVAKGHVALSEDSKVTPDVVRTILKQAM
ncbi:MAG: iron-containing alcohol dehydrogenase [Desulfovibrionaceae bacterium]|nr:iron-containing alcohol dehydrogenase [Desulfovibrionaceae bacterium]